MNEKRRNKPTFNEDINQYSKIPPQAVDLEEAVLGACLLEKEAFEIVKDILQPQSFYKEAHTLIFAAFNELYNKSEPIDLLTVVNCLRTQQNLEVVGGAYYISQLTSKLGSAANVEFHAKVVCEKFLKREMIRLSTENIQQAYDDSVGAFDLIDEAKFNLENIDSVTKEEKSFERVGDLITAKEVHLKELSEMECEITGLSTGFNGLDANTGGFQESDLIYLAARPGQCKTTIAKNIADNVAENLKDDECVVVFSLEVGSLQYAQNVIASKTFIESDRLKRAKLTDVDFKDISDKTQNLKRKNYFIDDTPGISVQKMKSRCRKLAKKYKIKLIVIDYVQLATTTNKHGSREQEVSEISRELKVIAKTVKAPILALAQTSREVEKTASKRAMLSHLRESGSLEADADMVLFVMRPNFYGINEVYIDNVLFNEDMENLIVLDCAKHRNGGLFEIPLRTLLQYNLVTDWRNQFIQKPIQSFNEPSKEHDDFGNNEVKF